MSWMKTKAALAAVVLGTTAFTATAPATAAENWSMATPWGGGPLLEYLAKGIGKEVELLTNNEIKVEVFPGGTLGKALKVTDTVSKGVAKMGHNWAGYDWGIDRTAVLFRWFLWQHALGEDGALVLPRRRRRTPDGMAHGKIRRCLHSLRLATA